MFLIKKINYMNILILIMFPQSLKSEELNINTVKDTQFIESYFNDYPEARGIIWAPEVDGFTRFEFKISKNAYFQAKKYRDSSDLYYLSKVEDNDISLTSRPLRNFGLTLKESQYKLSYLQNINENFLIGGHILPSDNRRFGGEFSYTKVMDNSKLFNIYTVIKNNNMSNIKLTGTSLNKNEFSEFFLFGKLYENQKHNIFSIGQRWFDVYHNYDIIPVIAHRKNKLEFSLQTEATFDKYNIKFGVNVQKKSTQTKAFFELTKVFISNNNLKYTINAKSSNNSNIDYKSLKSIRIHALPQIWKENFGF